MKAAKNCNSKH